MTSQQLDEERIFQVARRLGDGELRSEYLDQVCAGDQALRERVEALLAVHDEEKSFLKSGNAPAPTIDQQPPITEAPGQQIGRFKLLQKIGEGGFGVVYMAEQSKPVRRKVALKVIKPGMDTNEVIARFEAERQALAMMDHPGIANVHDGGATDEGRPYFVMELVKGTPITEYCDANKLTTSQRLHLFVNVCQAIQHAHQKGIIHRDIKPSNVLVTLHDGKPVVKVIDFGVAKAINQQLTERTLFTQFGQMVGTPQYMSPEQAEMSGLDVDTRSDIYSLGVLLYQLITGTTPLDAERLRAAGYAEIQRLIKEEEPQRPSTRLSTAGEKVTIVAQQRSVSPDQLHKQIKGDLDWIVMKSLEKDRSNRYESAADFSRDVNNYLRDEPILARPPGTWYRSTKALKRHRVFFASAGVIAATLLFATGISVWQAMRAHWTSKIARQEAERANAAETRAIGEAVRANQIAQEQAVLVKKHRDVLTEIALMYAFDADVDGANRIAGVLHDLEGSKSQAHLIEGVAAFYAGRVEPARRSFEKALAEDHGNVSAAAMLSVLAAYAGNEDANQMRHDALQMDPRPEYQICDRLFLAYALGFQNPEAAVERLKALVEERPSSPIIRAHLAAALADLASYKDVPDQRAVALDHVHEAWPHLEIARESTRDNFMVAFADLFVHVVAIRLSMLSDENTPDPSLVLEGRELCERVSKNHEFGTGLEAVAWFHELVKSPDKEIEAVYEQLVDLGGVRGISCIRFARGDENWGSVFTEEVMASVMGRTLRGILAAAEPRRDDEQMMTWRKLFDELDDTSVALNVLHIPLLLGDLQTVRRLCKERMKSDPPLSMAQGIGTRFSYSRLKYLADGLDDSWLLNEAGHGGERLEAHFQIAMRYLAQRDFSNAKSHLERAVEMFGPWSNEHHWARAILGRIDDPSWQSRIRRAGIKAESMQTGNRGIDD